MRLLLLLSFILFASCNKQRKTYELKSETTSIHSVLPHFGIERFHKIGNYKLDYSENGHLKISYSNKPYYGKSKLDLLKINNKYYNYFDLNSKDSLSADSYLFLSTDPADSYRKFFELKPKNGEPPLPNQGRYLDDSVIFKKDKDLIKMYIKDNQSGNYRTPEYYYNDQYEIVKIVERVFAERVIYK